MEGKQPWQRCWQSRSRALFGLGTGSRLKYVMRKEIVEEGFDGGAAPTL